MEQVLPFTFALMILGTGSYSADNETTSQESKPEHSQNNLIETCLLYTSPSPRDA